MVLKLFSATSFQSRAIRRRYAQVVTTGLVIMITELEIDWH